LSVAGGARLELWERGDLATFEKNNRMTILLIVLGAIGGIILLIVLFGLTRPRHTHLERSVTINTWAETVWPLVNNLRNFVEHWSPWSEKDPNASKEFNAIAEGKGAVYSWKGHPRKSGTGSMEIVESEHHKLVKVKIVFKGRGSFYANWMLSEMDMQTGVTWNFDQDHGNNPVSRIFGTMMEKFLGPDYEQGLATLKAHCER
jgi:hypothetical protein